MRNLDRKQTDEPKDGLNTMDDLLEAAGTNGWFNILIYISCAWGAFVPPLHTLSYQFLGATSDYWCSVPELSQANWTTEQIISLSVPLRLQNTSLLESCQMNNLNYSLLAQYPYEEAKHMASTMEGNMEHPLTSCSIRNFNASAPETVSTMWDLVCDRRYLYSTTQSAVQGGMLFGSIGMGLAADLFGRRLVFVWSVPAALIVGILTAFAPNVTVYILLKVLLSVIGMSFYLCGMVLSLELCSASQRSYIGPLFAMPWAIGYMLLPGIAYLVRDFRSLQIVMSCCGITLIPVFFIIPESPRWLVMKGRFEEAIQVFKRIASKNKRTLPSDDKMTLLLHKIHDDVKQNQDSSFSLRKMYELWLRPGWRVKIPIIFFAWFSVSLVYYGISLNPPSLSQDKYLYIFLGGVMEVPSYLLLVPITKYVGRKKGMILLFVLCAVSIFGSMAVVLSKAAGAGTASTYVWNMVLFLIGKFAVTAVFQLIWMYTTEFCPTDHRPVIVGEASVCARIGGICSPYIIDLLGASVKWAPPAIFGTLSMVTALLMLWLPETKDLALAESSATTNPKKHIESTSM